jgi:hypothetical protein
MARANPAKKNQGQKPSGRVEEWRHTPEVRSIRCSPFPLRVPHESNRKLVSIPRHVERSMQISCTPLSCPLRKKIYETQPIGGAFEPDLSPASTPRHPTASVFPFLYILCLRSCRLPSVFTRRPCLPSLPEKLRNSWVPSLPGNYPSSSLL